MLKSVVWCLLRGIKSRNSNTAKREPPKIFMSSLIDVLFVLFIWNTQLSFPTVISQPTPFLIFSFAPSLSLSLSLSTAHAPLHYYLPPFDIKGNWLGWSASLNEHISTNIVPYLGVAHNTRAPGHDYPY